ncbi:hypothetical protein K5D34_21755, partial [Pseudomonas cichorii]|nr:hypothetical protein [Pseudomonas cichorii]
MLAIELLSLASGLSSNKTQCHELKRLFCEAETFSGVHIHYRYVLVLLVPPLRRPPFVSAKGGKTIRSGF